MGFVPEVTVRQSVLEVQLQLSTGEYSSPYLDRYYPDRTARLIHESEQAGERRA